MKKMIILSEKKWHDDLCYNLKKSLPSFNWIHLKNKEDFNLTHLRQINPDKIFIPHWSHIIHENIYSEFECILFHMTDLPFGRGGSPLQNLIIRGFNETKITALKVEKGLDTGPIYIKAELSLHGTAQEIFLNSSNVIQEMIIKIIQENIHPKNQLGSPIVFKRRKPSDGNIEVLKKIDEVYDYIRMLDADGYPNAFIEFGEFRLEFSRAKKESNKTLLADVRIIKK